MRSAARRLTRTTAAAVALAALVLAAGCSGGDEPSDATAQTSSPTPSPAAEDGDDGEDAGYLPVPEGVTLTEPGAKLDLKDSAGAAWLPRQDLVGVVEVAVTRVDVTTVQKSLAGFDLDADEQRSTPYFVRTKVTNVGDTDLGARQLPVYFLDRRGVLVAPTGVARDFEACPGSILPAVFAPGDRTTSCLIFLVPEGQELQAITFRPPDGVVPLRWTGRVTDPKSATGRKQGASKKSDADGS